MVGVAAYVSVGGGGENDLVGRYAPLVKRIAYHLMSRLPPNIQLEDLVQSGMIGLLEASRNYDPSQGASFETFAGIRIRGAMLDEIRRSDWTPRSVHRKARAVAEAMRQLEAQHGRDAEDHEVAENLGISLDEYYQILKDSTVSKVFSLDELAANGEVVTSEVEDDVPFTALQQANFHRSLVEAIAALPERERLVISMYYNDELNLREIGQVLGVSESRVCQIHGQAALRLRAKLSDWMQNEA